MDLTGHPNTPSNFQRHRVATGVDKFCRHKHSRVYATELERTLNQAGIRQLNFTGCTTSVCVESTLRDAYFRDYQAVLPTDCVAEPIGQSSTRTNHDASVLLVETVFGWVATSEQFIDACSAHRAAAPPASFT